MNQKFWILLGVLALSVLADIPHYTKKQIG